MNQKISFCDYAGLFLMAVLLVAFVVIDITMIIGRL